MTQHTIMNDDGMSLFEHQLGRCIFHDEGTDIYTMVDYIHIGNNPESNPVEIGWVIIHYCPFCGSQL